MGQEILQLFRQSTEKARLSRPRIGTMLLVKKWITPEQLKRALEAQRQHGQKLGHWLVKLGYISEEKLIIALSEQLRLPWMNEIKKPFNQDALDALPKMLCKRFNVFPLEFAKNNHLVLAVDYGFTDEMIDAVDEVVGCKVKPFVTKTNVLAGLIDEHVERQEDNTTDVIAEHSNLANQVGSRFVKKWFDFEAEKARFGVFEDTLWVRYLRGESIRDHFILFDEHSVGSA
jgi:MSHA biogenesis protein MshE